MVYLDGLAVVRIDAGPDDVASCRPFLVWKTMARGWPTSFRLPLRALGEIEILIAGDVVFGLVGVDGQRIEIFDALRRLRLCVPFMKGAAQVLCDSAAQVRHLDIVVVVVELVEQMCGELLAAAPLISFRDHGVSLEHPR
jgi:hypothetical protein